MHGSKSIDNLGSKQICLVCRQTLGNKNETVETACRHIFHTTCLVSWLKKNTSCPKCKSRFNSKDLPQTLSKSVGMVTRSQSQIPPLRNSEGSTPAANTVNQTESDELIRDIRNTSTNDASQIEQPSTSRGIPRSLPASPLQNLSNRQNSNDEDQRIHNIVSALVNARTTASIENIESRLASLIEQRVEEHFSSHRTVSPQSTPNRPQDMPSGRNWNKSIQNPSPRTSDISLALNSSRMAQLINSWDIKFDGSSNLSVENFTYRIESQVVDTLGGNFNILCDHLQNIFVGEARGWYWRYRRSVQRITWPSLCEALRADFGKGHTDFDIKELMRVRKQGSSESFDEYRNVILKIGEDLSHPLSEAEMVEILLRGLRPRLRQQLLFVPINGSMATLRQFCIKGESLQQELSKSFPTQAYAPNRNKVPQRNVDEIDLEQEEEFESEVEIAVVKGSKLICWNCRKEGHRYFDCLEERNLFCYGCGAIGIYKPNCSHCTGNGKKGEIPPTRSCQR